MELKPGYKQTEVGVIPEDWNVCDLGDAVEFLDGLRKPIKSSDRAKIRGVYPYYGASGIVDYVNGYIFDEELILLGEDGENILSRNLPLAFRVSGKIWVNNHAHVMRPKKAFSIGYLTEFLESRDYLLLNSGTAQPKLNKQTCLKIKIAQPTKTEQTAIANALSDADALIQSLTRLIAKKRQIKQGAMQTLLNPYEDGQLKKGWVVKKLGDIFESFQLGGNYANSEVETDFPLIKMGNLGRGVINLARIEYIKPGIAVAEKDRLIRGDVLFNTRNTLELVGKVAIWLDELPSAYFNSNIMRLKFKSNFVSSNVYMNSLLNHQRQIQQLKGMATGTTSVAAIYTRDLIGLEIPLAPKIEQLRIATTLSDMDAEIAALETKLAKYRQIKQGMMQNLLTGRIRLVKPESKTGAVA